MMKLKHVLIFSLVLLSLSVSLSFKDMELFQKSNIEKLPIFNLTIPSNDLVKSFVINQLIVNNFEIISEMKIIIHLKEPLKVWPSEVSNMNKKEINNLKTIMKEYSINKIGRNKVKYEFGSFNGFSATVNQKEYQELLNNPFVENIEEDKIMQAFMQDTVGIIGANETWNMQVNENNITGKGQTVCIVDSGIDYTHLDLGGCQISTIQSVSENYTLSPVVPNPYTDNYDNTWIITKEGYEKISVYFNYLDLEYYYDGNLYDYVIVMDESNNVYQLLTGNYSEGIWSVPVTGDTIKIQFVTDEDINGNDGYLGFSINETRNSSYLYEQANWSACSKIIGGYDYAYGTNNPIDSHGHGTHVAGTIAGNGVLKGVAPNAKLVAVKSLNQEGWGYTSDIIAGIEYCTDNSEIYNISVISMSLGGGLYNSYCDDSQTSYASAINAAVAKNISVVVATGNDGNDSYIASPSCVFNSTRVGSTEKEDTNISSFSNGWEFDMIVAPGSLINSTIMGGGYGLKSGTSMATPHVAGAIALINQYLSENNEQKTPNFIKEVLKQTGKIINEDSRNYSRIDLPNFFDSYSSTLIFDPITINSTNNISSIYANSNHLIFINFTTNQVINTPKVIIGNYEANVVNLGSNTSWSAFRILNSSDNQGVVPININDENYSTTDGSYVIFDYLAPEIIDYSAPLFALPGENFSIILNYSTEFAPLYMMSIPNYDNNQNVSFEGNGIDGILNYTYNSSNEHSGTYMNFTFELWDVTDNSSFFDVSVFINDTLPPIINIISPINGSSYNYANQLLNISVIEPNIDRIWYNYNGTNITYNDSLMIDFTNGINNLNVWANDTYGRVSSDNITFFINHTEKLMIINSPNEYLNIPSSINLSFSNYNTTNVFCEIYLNNSLFDSDFLTNTDEYYFYYLDNLNESYYNLTLVCNNTVDELIITNSTNIIINNAPKIESSISLNSFYNENETILINTTWNNELYGYLESANLIVLENFTNNPNLMNVITYSFQENYTFNTLNNSVEFNYKPYINMTGKNLTFLISVLDNYSAYNYSELLIPEFYENGTLINITFIPKNNLTTYIKDIIPPILNLNFLNEYSNNNTQIITFNISDNVDFKEVNCSLYLNNNYNQSLIIYPNSSSQIFNINLVDGSYNYSVKCVDYDLNQVNKSYDINIDSIKPMINILSLINNYYYSNITKLLNLSRIDTTSGSVWYNWNGINLSYIEPINITFNEGVNTLIVYSNDSAGNFNQTTISFTIDTVKPKININSLSNNFYYNNATQLLNISRIDVNSGSVWYNFNGTNITYNNSLFEVFNEGSNNLIVYSNDSASNLNQTSVNFIIDTVAPLVTLNSLTNDSWTNKLFTNVSYKFVDTTSINSSCQLKLNNVIVNTNNYLANNTLINYNHKNINSINNYNFSCTDLASNINSTIVTLNFDSVTPRTNASGYSLNNNGWTNQDINIILTANDSLSGINKTQFKNSTSQWIDYNYNLNITNDFLGALEYRAIDNAGNIEASKYLIARVDKTNPVIVSILSSSNIVSSNDLVTIEVLTYDSLSGILNTSATINGNNYELNYLTGKYYTTFTSPVNEGVYEIIVTVFDKANNYINSSINLTVSNVLPSTKLNIANASVVSNNTQLNLDFFNADNSSIIVNGNETNTLESTYDLTIFGINTFNFDVINYNTNNNTINNYIYYIDAINPQILINNLNNNDKINSTILFNVSAIDNYELINVSLFIDNILYQSKRTSPFMFYYPTTLLSDGLHNFTVIAYDSVLQSNSSTVILNITNHVTLNLNVTGDFNLSSGEITREDIRSTNIGSVIYEINGLNSSAINITLSEGNYSQGLSSTIGSINISASTNAESEIYFLIPKQILENLNLTTPYVEISVHAIHSNGEEQELNVSYDSLVLIDELEFERFKFSTTHYSTFYYGIDATCSDGLQNQDETGIDCGGSCNACQSNNDDNNDDNNDNTNNVFTPSLGGNVITNDTQNNESEVNNSKTYEYVNYNNQNISKNFQINKVLNINISGSNYSFEISSMNTTYVYLNISNYGLVKLFVGKPKTVTLNNETFFVVLESIISDTANISFNSLSNIEINEELEPELITAQIISKINEEISENKTVGYVILIITGITAVILFILKIIRVL
jgi:subtilisin family serine protease